MKVKECMSFNVCCCTPQSTVTDVCKEMQANHVGCIPVCDDQNKVVGVLTDRDIVLRTIACDKDPKTTPVSEIMTCKTCCCTPDTDLGEATKLMAELQIRRIPVCDENNKVVGILTMGDLTQNENQIGLKQVCNTIENICNHNKNCKNAE